MYSNWITKREFVKITLEFYFTNETILIDPSYRHKSEGSKSNSRNTDGRHWTATFPKDADSLLRMAMINMYGQILFLVSSQPRCLQTSLVMLKMSWVSWQRKPPWHVQRTKPHRDLMGVILKARIRLSGGQKGWSPASSHSWETSVILNAIILRGQLPVLC